MNRQKCRLCLEASNKYVDIFLEDFSHMIELLTGLKVHPEDALPKIACSQCHKEVKSAMLTRYQIIHSHKVLLEEISSASPITQELKLKLKDKLATDDRTHDNSESCVLIFKNVSENCEMGFQTKDESVVKSEDDEFQCDENRNTFDNYEYDNLTSEDNGYLLKNAKTVIKAANQSHKDEQGFKRLIEKLQRRDQAKVKFARKKGIKKINVKVQFKKKSKNCEINTNMLSSIKAEHVEFLSTIGKKDRVACPICSKEMFGMNMKNHLITHNYDPVICSECGKTSKNAQALQDHINYYHKTTPDRFVCDKCGRGFRVKCALDKHEKKEHGSGEKDFECTICGKRFFEKTHLKNHVDITHNKIRPFKCEHCGKDFGRRTQFVTHQLVHTKENKYHCQVCGKGFKIKQTMQTHLKGVHGIEEQKTIFCEICKKGFSSAQGLRAHINSRVHGLEKCDYCSEYITLDYKSIHLKEMHGIETNLIL